MPFSFDEAIADIAKDVPNTDEGAAVHEKIMSNLKSLFDNPHILEMEAALEGSYSLVEIQQILFQPKENYMRYDGNFRM